MLLDLSNVAVLAVANAYALRKLALDRPQVTQRPLPMMMMMMTSVIRSSSTLELWNVGFHLPGQILPILRRTGLLKKGQTRF